MAVRTAIGKTIACVITASPSPEGRLWALQLHRAHSDLERALRASVDAHERRFRVVAERSPVPTILSEQGMRLGHVNDAFCALLGTTSDKLVGTGWLAHAHLDDLDRITDTVLAVLDGEQREIEARFLDSAQRLHFTDVRFTPIHTPGVGDGFLATLEDTTERRAFEEQLNHQATHDSLTGLPRRNKLWDHIAQAMQDPDSRLACLFLDLDNFKIVNDSLGHNAGDALLVEVANRLTKVMRNGDMVARFGGDEFVVAERDRFAGGRALCGGPDLAGALRAGWCSTAWRSVPRPRSEWCCEGPSTARPTTSSATATSRCIRRSRAARAASWCWTRTSAAPLTTRSCSFLSCGGPSSTAASALSYQPIVRYRGDCTELISVEALARWRQRAGGGPAGRIREAG